MRLEQSWREAAGGVIVSGRGRGTSVEAKDVAAVEADERGSGGEGK